MRVFSTVIFFCIGCRDKNFIPPSEPNDTGAENGGENEDVENVSEDGNANNENSEEEQPETPNNGTPSDTEDSGQNNTVLNPEFIIYTVSHGYEHGEITEVVVEDEIRMGTFSAIMYDTIAEDYCSVDWSFDSTTVVADENLNTGSVEDINGYQSTTWFGFLITSSPQTSGNCNLNANGQYFKDLLLQDEPGFGYGPLTESLESYLGDGHYGDWDAMENYVFTGFVSSMIFDHGNRLYLDINTAYAYPIEDGTTTWIPSHDTPQGTEILKSELPSDGFYVSRYFFAIPLH